MPYKHGLTLHSDSIEQLLTSIGKNIWKDFRICPPIKTGKHYVYDIEIGDKISKLAYYVNPDNSLVLSPRGRQQTVPLILINILKHSMATKSKPGLAKLVINKLSHKQISTLLDKLYSIDNASMEVKQIKSPLSYTIHNFSSHSRHEQAHSLSLVNSKPPSILTCQSKQPESNYRAETNTITHGGITEKSKESKEIIELYKHGSLVYIGNRGPVYIRLLEFLCLAEQFSLSDIENLLLLAHKSSYKFEQTAPKYISDISCKYLNSSLSYAPGSNINCKSNIDISSSLDEHLVDTKSEFDAVSKLLLPYKISGAYYLEYDERFFYLRLSIEALSTKIIELLRSNQIHINKNIDAAFEKNKLNTTLEKYIKNSGDIKLLEKYYRCYKKFMHLLNKKSDVSQLNKIYEYTYKLLKHSQK